MAGRPSSTSCSVSRARRSWPVTASPRHDRRGARRTPYAAGAGRNAFPLPALLIAVVAIAFFALPFLGLLWRVAVG